MGRFFTLAIHRHAKACYDTDQELLLNLRKPTQEMFSDLLPEEALAQLRE